MPSFADFMVVVGMIALRFGVPALVIAGIAYLLKQLDRRWEAEARDYAAKQVSEQLPVQPEAPKPVERPAMPAREPAPAPQLPFIIPPPAIRDQRQQLAQPGMMAPVADNSRRTASRSAASAKPLCATPSTAEKPCWQTRLGVEGKIPDECVRCDVFQSYPTV